MRVAGHLYLAASSARGYAVLARRGGRFHIAPASGGGAEQEVAIAHWEEPLAGLPQTLTLADGRRFVPFQPLPPGFAPPRRLQLAWLERVSPAKALVLVALLALAAGAIQLAVPLAADGMAALVPAGVEREIGRRAFASLDRVALAPTRIAAPRRAQIVATASELARRNAIPRPAILFRRSSWLGANALAFPGGPVVITDALVELLDHDEVVAVIAHEFAHIQARHGLRQSLRIGGLLLLVSLAVADDGSPIEEVAALAASLGHLGYSRAFELEADAAAARYLAAAGLPPRALVSALAKLAADCGAGCDDAGWLSTHPSPASRIEAL